MVLLSISSEFQSTGKPNKMDTRSKDTQGRVGLQHVSVRLWCCPLEPTAQLLGDPIWQSVHLLSVYATKKHMGLFRGIGSQESSVIVAESIILTFVKTAGET